MWRLPSFRLELTLAAVALSSCQWNAGPPPDACVPVPSSEARTQAAGWGERSWMDQVEDIQKAIDELDPQLILIGDSITQGWGGGGRQVGGAGQAARQAWLEPLGPVVNAGISGDRTQHVFWRLETGKMRNMYPAFIVLMIGTNNLPHDSAQDIAAGVRLVLEQLQQDVPSTRLVLMSCPPRGQSPEEELRQRGDRLNQRLMGIAKRLGVDWLDLTPLLVDETGQARADRMAKDYVHFSPAGYQAVGEALHDHLLTTFDIVFPAGEAIHQEGAR